MKFTDVMFVAIIVSLLIFTALSGGCAVFQSGGNPGSTLADLPTTGSEAMFQTLKKANWLFTIAALGFGAGFYAFLNGSNKGLQFMAACFVVISLIIGVTRYSAVIAVISLIGAVSLMVYSTLIKGKAMREIVQGVELARTIKLESHEVYPENKILEAMSDMQSKTTKAIVKSVKGKL